LEGVLQPFSDMAFDVTFKPVETNDDLRIEGIRLLCEGVGPFVVSCAGVCVPLPTKNVKTLSFEGAARKGEVKSITIANPTDKPFFLQSVLRGAHWKVPEDVTGTWTQQIR
jgi:hypothetical protein